MLEKWLQEPFSRFRDHLSRKNRDKPIGRAESGDIIGGESSGIDSISAGRLPVPPEKPPASLRCYLWLLGVLRCLTRANFACLGVRKSKPSCLSCTSCSACSSCPDSPRWFTALTSLRSGASGSGATGIAALILLRWLRPDDSDSSDDSDNCVSIWSLGRNIVESSEGGSSVWHSPHAPRAPRAGRRVICRCRNDRRRCRANLRCRNGR